jgi:hypothetical protein
MFTVDRSLDKIDARPSEIVTLLVSTNRPLVALSGPQQQADAFIVSVNRGKTQPIFLCFHVIKEGERLIYTSNTVPTSPSARVKLEEEAVRFAEDMGFMMVREEFDGFSQAERDKTIMGLAPFVDDISTIGHDDKPDKKRKKDSAARAAESEMEYEEVYEEVEEEVPVEEGEEEPPKPEEYESLADVVTEVSSPETLPEQDKGARATGRDEVPPDASEPAHAVEEGFDLGEELSDVVETIREIPGKAHPAQRTAAAVGMRVSEPKAEPPSRPEPSPRAQSQPEPAAEPADQSESAFETPVELGTPAGQSDRAEDATGRSEGTVSDKNRAVIKLLISL